MTEITAEQQQRHEEDVRACNWRYCIPWAVGEHVDSWAEKLSPRAIELLSEYDMEALKDCILEGVSRTLAQSHMAVLTVEPESPPEDAREVERK